MSGLFLFKQQTTNIKFVLFNNSYNIIPHKDMFYFPNLLFT